MSYYPPPMPKPQPDVEIDIKNDSQRLELLEPFASHFGSSNPRGMELPLLEVLVRVRGKCTTDHISAAVSLSRAQLVSALIFGRQRVHG